MTDDSELQVFNKLDHLSKEKMLFGEARYKMSIHNSNFKITDNYKTSSKSPPIVKGQLIRNEKDQLAVNIKYIPSNYQINKYLISVVVIVFVFIINLTTSSFTQFFDSLLYSLLFGAFWAAIVTLNARDSLMRTKETIEETFNLTRK